MRPGKSWLRSTRPANGGLGDWWNACAWGDGKDACEALGINYGTAQNCGQIAATFDFTRRRVNLSFSHHYEVCPIEDPTMQDKLLDWADRITE